MKAAVITLHNVCNYGTQLQVYATQEKLKEYFDEVIFIDYRRPDTCGVKYLNTFAKNNLIKALIILPTLLRYQVVFRRFQNKKVKTSGKKYLKDSDFEQFEDIADVYFSGSDQVWNTGWNRGVIPAYYLSFVPKGKFRYAYASSFGLQRIPDSHISESKKYIDLFEWITVREESGVNILKCQYQYEKVTRILDPTLAMSGDWWRSVAPKNKIDGDYILVYNLARNPEMEKYALELSKRTGYKLYRLCTRYDQIILSGRSILIPEIFSFITLIDNAKLVLTDSFHATAFSMNLETEPICVYPKKYSSRLADFLEMLGESQRALKDFADFDILNRKVNFIKVKKILDQEREKVDGFLKDIVNRKSVE